ncbi:hypothetical protein T4D_8321 [Trichinella pseudospiralis]|uniref:Uncharacterized protein n=1 Tax=Trichinella pseudospiralis TaxID=6337 RepID=A0A0V1DST2_TRIPS|nr:hypothetical protein T4D_8321 [Trichinella pseudospiralis]
MAKNFFSHFELFLIAIVLYWKLPISNSLGTDL